MGKESVLLLFDTPHPCWNRENTALAGEDPEMLELLRREGLLREEGGVYALTESGKERFRSEAAECWLDAVPGDFSGDGALAARRHLLALLLNRAFVGRWGEKTFRPGAALPFLPPRCGAPLGHWTGAQFSWRYAQDAFLQEMDRRFPVPRGGEDAPVCLEAVERWRVREGVPWETLELDLLGLQRYDVDHYRRFAPHPHDRFGLLNTDRLYCLFSPDPFQEHFFDEIFFHVGRLHLFLKAQRQIFLPWRFDHDMEEQPSANWAFFVTETEAEARRGAELLAPVGASLLEGATPLDLWTLSLEALRAVKTPHETFWDLFAETAIAVGRTC